MIMRIAVTSGEEKERNGFREGNVGILTISNVSIFNRKKKFQ